MLRVTSTHSTHIARHHRNHDRDSVTGVIYPCRVGVARFIICLVGSEGSGLRITDCANASIGLSSIGAHKHSSIGSLRTTDSNIK